MTEQEISLLVGEWIYSNWKIILGGLVTAIGAVASASWFVCKQFHEKEIRILNLEISHKREHFAQFQMIMSARVEQLGAEAESLKEKLAAEIDLDEPWNQSDSATPPNGAEVTPASNITSSESESPNLQNDSNRALNGAAVTRSDAQDIISQVSKVSDIAKKLLDYMNLVV